ncbi:MAG: glycosyltransferase family 9 protein [Pyrinomonadaceae bacterium]
MTINEPRQKVLAYLIGSLGDTIVAIPALRAVRRTYPTAEIILLQNTAAANVVQASDVIPPDLVDRHITYISRPGLFEKLTEYFILWWKIRQESVGIAVYLVISERPPRSVARDRKFFRACGIETLIGFHPFSPAELYPSELGRPSMTAHESARKLERLHRDGVSASLEDLQSPLVTASFASKEKVRGWLVQNRRRPDLPLIAVAPGCKTPANAWPIENFIEIVMRLINQERYEVVLVGGKADKALAARIVTVADKCIDAVGCFSVSESSALLAECDAYFGADTGTTHLAAAVGTRCFVVCHERTNPGQWFPLGEGHVVVHHEVPCAGCRASICPVEGHPCMREISPNAVREEFQRYLAGGDVDRETYISV